MKNNKGISLIALLVTIIVIIIMSSITIYNGSNMIKDARKKSAEDRLKTMCSAILKDDSFLNFSGDNEVVLSEADFDYMDLLKYYDTDYTFLVKKEENILENQKQVKYFLEMQKNSDATEKYTYSFNYVLSNEKYNYTISFDEENGVNRPLVIDGMIAIKSGEGTEAIAVNDIYKEKWYSYKKATSNFAKVKYKDKIYVWIPRFAYSIQKFYEGREMSEVPSSAISIVFLRENSNYMTNDEVIPGEYKVHPAFSKDDVEYSGIWVEKDAVDIMTSINSPLQENEAEYNLHLMTNMECGAAIYLAYAFDSENQIDFDKTEYMAACLSNGIGKFSSSNGFVTVYTAENGTLNANGIYGDALIETPWNRYVCDNPTEEKPFIIRKFASGLFDYTNSDGTDTAYSRGVITIK